jgi:hypothetical protein
MNCSTVKPGTACTFMSPKGCSFNGGSCHPVIEQCEGCDRSKTFESGMFCLSTPDPSQKWKLGNCNLATHIKKTPVQAAAKINPLKASKRSTR